VDAASSVLTRNRPAALGIGYDGSPGNLTARCGSRDTLRNSFRAGVPNRQQQQQEALMAQNHYVSKSKRRPKNTNRKDYSQATMAAIRESEAKEKKKAAASK